MRILKYVLLLIVLGILAFSVFIATQDSHFEVTRSRVINLPKATIFQYLNNYKNWAEWGSWIDDDPDMKFTFPANTIGKGASYSWEGNNGSGTIETIHVTENDSISQKVIFSGNESMSSISLKDTKKGTLINWSTKGSLSFMGKFYALLSGGMDKMIGNMYESSLHKLERILVDEINSYKINIIGITQVSPKIYLQKKATSNIPDFYNQLNELLPTIENFANNNNIIISGNSFVVFDSYSKNLNKIDFSVCVPLKEEIFTTPNSEFTSSNFDTYQALKIVLKGDYSHSKEAWDKGLAYIKANNLEESTTGRYMEVYVKKASDFSNPSKWITEIYIPVRKKSFNPILKDSTAVSTQ